MKEIGKRIELQGTYCYRLVFKFPKEKALKRSCGSIKNNEVNKKRSVQNITKECILGSIILIVSMLYYSILLVYLRRKF